MHHPSENYTPPTADRHALDRPALEMVNGAAPIEPAADGSHSTRYSRPFVLMVIMLTVAVTLIAISLIYFRWLNVSEPVSAIVVEGDESIAPTKLRLTSPDHPVIEPPELNAQNKYIMPVLLHPGSYVLTARQDDRVLIQLSFKIEPHRGISVSLPKAIEEAKRRRENGGK